MRHPVYRERYLAALTASGIREIPDRSEVPVIVPTGAIEQHGPHLPVGVDSILGQYWLNTALPQVPADIRVYVAPPITIGKSDEHRGFPGTLFISTQTLGRLLMVIAKQIKAFGFRNIAIFNTHGGNLSVLRTTMREIQASLGVRVCFLRHGYEPPLPEQERVYGFHANTMETACMLEATEGLVNMAKARCEYPAKVDDSGELRPEGAPATFAWVTSDVSESGIVGDATAATPDKAREWVANYASSLAREIVQLAEWARSGGGERRLSNNCY